MLPLLDIIQAAQKLGFSLIVTTDHGTINVKNSVEVVGDKESSQNLRYKTGRSLKYPAKKVMEARDPRVL